MKKQAVYLLLFLLPMDVLLAQASDSGGSYYFTYGLIAIAAILFLGLVLNVSDNLLAVEAKRGGVDTDPDQVSIYPRLNDIFTPKAPDYVDEDERVVNLKRGFDIKLEGEAELRIEPSMEANTFAVQPGNFVGMIPIPKVVVEQGQSVKAGDELFFDKKRPDIKYVAPVSGEIIAINRGEKRSIREIIILADKEQRYRDLPAFDLESSTREELVKYLVEYGGWTMFNQRPFDIVPEIDEVPRDIFISTFDTAPLAPDLNFVVEGKGAAFQKGLDVLNKLTDGSVFLGMDARREEAPSPVFTQAQGVVHRWFRGKHPAGNVGVQIHNTKPINIGDRVWTLGVQDVITLGKMFTERRFDTERIVALAGAELKQPLYIKTHIGASLNELLKDNLASEHVRIISGDVLSGEKKAQDSFLNYRDDQITVIEEGDYYEMFGWLLPLKMRPSKSRTYPNFLFPDVKFQADTNMHGEKRAFVVTGQYEEVLPMDIYLQHLMKAILVNDFEKIEGLGIYELSEEDVALPEFVCTSKQPLQLILREGLDLMREQG